MPWVNLIYPMERLGSHKAWKGQGATRHLQHSALSPIPTVSPLLTLVASRNILLLQSLPNSIPYRQANGRRRKDAHRVGTAARGSIARLSCVPRRVPSDGRPSGRVRGALSTGTRDRG